MTVNARSEADIDENDIIQKVAKSSGSQYSIHKEKAKPQDREPSGPVVRYFNVPYRMGKLSREATLHCLFCFPSQKLSTLKGRICTQGANSFLNLDMAFAQGTK